MPMRIVIVSDIVSYETIYLGTDYTDYADNSIFINDKKP